MDEIAETGVIDGLTLCRLSSSGADGSLEIGVEALLTALIPVLGGGMDGYQVRLYGQGLIDLIEQGRAAQEEWRIRRQG
jgi:hypothetical protein